MSLDLLTNCKIHIIVTIQSNFIQFIFTRKFKNMHTNTSPSQKELKTGNAYYNFSLTVNENPIFLDYGAHDLLTEALDGMVSRHQRDVVVADANTSACLLAGCCFFDQHECLVL